MGRNQRRDTLLADQLNELAEHMLGRFRIEIARRLVGQKQLRRVGKAAADCGPLLLAARHSRRPVIDAIRKANAAKQFARPRLRLAPRGTADQLRNDDVLKRGKFRQQLMKLIDEADIRAPQPRAVLLRHLGAVAAIDDNAAAGRRLQQACNVQQRRLAGARWADECDRLACPQLGVGPLQHRNITRALAERARHVFKFEDRPSRYARARISGGHHSYLSASMGSSLLAFHDG